MKRIGDILTELRSRKGFTQDQLADALDIKRARYNSWENNIAKPDIEMLTKIARFHNVSTDYLLDHESDTAYQFVREAPAPPYRTDPFLDDLLKKVPNLTDEEKDSLAEHMQFALKIIEKERQKRATKKDGDVS